MRKHCNHNTRLIALRAGAAEWLRQPGAASADPARLSRRAACGTAGQPGGVFAESFRTD